MAVFSAPWGGELWDHFQKVKLVTGLASGAFVLGVCFLLGIVLDRFADTLTEELERHHRLRFAFKNLPAGFALENERWKDPFKEDELRLAMLRDSDHVVEWMDYHRSRVRLSRAMAVFLPALTLSIVVGAYRVFDANSNYSPTTWLLLILLAYALAASDSLYRKERTPSTDEARALVYAHKHGLLNGSRGLGQRLDLYKTIAREPCVLCAGALLLSAIVISIATWNAELCAVAGAGTVLSILSGWSWWRISETYRGYLRDIGRFPPD